MSEKKKEAVDNFEAIKRLLILQLLSQGVSLAAIGDVLGLDKSSVSRMVPQKHLKKGNNL